MHLRNFILSAALAASASAQGTGSMSLTELISSTSSLSSLGALLKKFPSIASTLASAKNVTLFAPNNAALDALLSSPAAKNLSTADVTALLEYHVLPEIVYASAVTETPAFLGTLLKLQIKGNMTRAQVVEAQLVDQSVIITSGEKQESKVVTANQNYTEGVVHIIDKVLTIPASVAVTAEVGGLTAFLGAVEAAGLAAPLQKLGDITIFAPANSAFEAIGSALGSLSKKELTEILEYHVVTGIAYSTDLKNESIPTVEGKDITITIEDGAVFVNAARVVNANILIEEGVLHVIDSVLNPDNSTAKPDPTASAPAVEFSGASSGPVAPLTKSLSAASTTVSALTATTPSVAASPSAMSSMSSSSAGGAALPTAAVGALALFGGAALLGNW